MSPRRPSAARAPRLLLVALRGLGVALVALMLAAACGGVDSTGTVQGGAEPAVTCDGSLASLEKNVFATTCATASCHGSASRAAGLDLSAPDLERELIGVGSGTCDGWVRVSPGSPERSLLWAKLHSESPPCGDPMPLGGHLSAVQLGCIREWIRSLPPSAGGGGDAGGMSVDGGGTGPGASCEQCSGTACVDLATDPAHCGTCSNSCPAGSACSAGKCMCDSTLALCGSACVDLQASADHCGACGKACPSGALCSGGECLCQNGESCGSACVDTTSDPANCGACGTKCASGQVCLAGQCASGCGSLTNCSGACVDTQTSAFACGGCSVKCPGGGSCVSGVCACPSGTADCGGVCIDVVSDPSNCGGCGKVCGSGQVCTGGKCECPGGGTVCGTKCVSLQTDLSNCGACGKVCASGQSCTAGQCVCPNGGVVCGGKCVDTSTDLLNCGACGKACGGGQACVSGVCQCSGGAVSFAGAIQPIFTQNCALKGCHGSVSPKEGLNLSSGAAYSNLVRVAATECSGRLRVAPGDPAVSYLMNKLMGVSLCSGSQMPKSGTSLPKAEIDAIGAWICGGAANN